MDLGILEINTLNESGFLSNPAKIIHPRLGREQPKIRRC